MKKSSVLLTIIVWFILNFSGCTTNEGSGIYPLSMAQVEEYSWIDDLNFDSLPKAIERSIEYYRQLPENEQFDYAGYIYTAKEMIASMQLFLDIIARYQGEQRIQEIQKKFLFFETKNNDGQAFFTGYYEPILEGSLEPTNEFQTPLYFIPDDFIVVDLGLFNEKLKGKRIRGRIKEKRFIPYDSRQEIAYENSLQNRSKVIAYVVNDIELFFLQIQGSGIIHLRDGSYKRVNYAAQNGHPYRAIGYLLRHKISRQEMSLQKLKEYLYSHPDEVQDILNYNPSYTFFREVEEGPLGNIEVPLTPGRSIAMDHKLLPRGGIAFIETIYPPLTKAKREKPNSLRRFMVVQDTGGAIRGHGRADIFWGYGAEAEKNAGHMKQKGRIFLLVARKEVFFKKNTNSLFSPQIFP